MSTITGREVVSGPPIIRLRYLAVMSTPITWVIASMGMILVVERTVLIHGR